MEDIIDIEELEQYIVEKVGYYKVQKYKLLPFSVLKNLNPTIYAGNRNVIENRIEELLHSFRESNDIFGIFALFITEKHELSIADGQHRFLAASKLFEETEGKFNPLVYIMSIQVEDNDKGAQTKSKYFNIFNNSIQLKDDEFNNETIILLISRINREFYGSSKEFKNRPHINTKEFIKQATLYFKNYPEKYENLFEKIKTLDIKIHRLGAERIKKLTKCTDSMYSKILTNYKGFHLGLFTPDRYMDEIFEKI